ncbi:MAG: response regulator [Provencibacterium sp.]|jgi:two-component system response regulator YesN|nr:response regulator [Provencibacterium sp.]
MVRLLIADDERIVRDGLCRLCDWPSEGIELCGCATTGEEAYRLILELRPDIVLIDIRMPVMSGLEVIEQIAACSLPVHFAILSGYGEFEYAKSAMLHGVNHFLLKPCGARKLLETIRSLRDEAAFECEQRRKAQELTQDLRRILPGVREQFLRDLIGERLSAEDIRHYLRLLKLDGNADISLCLLSPCEETTFEKLFVYLDYIMAQLPAGIVLCSCVLNARIMLVLTPHSYDALFALLHKVNQQMAAAGFPSWNSAVWDRLPFTGLPRGWKRLEDCLQQSLFAGIQGIVTPEDLSAAPAAYSFSYDQLTACIRAGNVEQTGRLVESFFSGLNAQPLSEEVRRGYSLLLFAHIIGQAGSGEIGRSVELLHGREDGEAVLPSAGAIQELAMQICRLNQSRNAEKAGRLVSQVLRCIEKNLADERLSLSFIAKEMLYINVDYLGKIFKKEMGERFSSYLLRARMEKARALLASGAYLRIYEVAQEVGFGDNAQYFSLQFKKAVGMTPSEYAQRAGQAGELSPPSCAQLGE